MIFVLDTDVLSERRRIKPNHTVAQWLERTDPSEMATTVVTIAEIQCGIERSRPTNPAASETLTKWLDAMLANTESFVFGLTAHSARLLGRMYELPRLRHFITTQPGARAPATGADLAIASIAIVAGASVATGNIRHFLQIHDAFPLPGLFDPFTQTWHVRRST